jgi:SAM-dependent methyltransferase
VASGRTSFQRINGDEPLSRMRRAAWLAGGMVFERLPRPRLAIRSWTPDPSLVRPDLLPAHATPPRVLCNLFWETLPGARIRDLLGGAVDVLDVGCGRGNYATVLDRAIRLDSYLGVDVVEDPRWAELERADPCLAFRLCRAEQIGEAELTGRTLIVSQSAVEHVRDDLAFFERVAAFLAAVARPVLQIHLLPAANLWRLWGVHGYRGYNERNLARIVAAFPAAHVDLLRLGGPACNRLHREAVHDTLRQLRSRTQPDLRTTDPDTYTRRLAEAIAEDAVVPAISLRDASFVALVITTGSGEHVFD